MIECELLSGLRLRHVQKPRADMVICVLDSTLAAKCWDCAPLAGKSILNRLEHAAKVGTDPYHKITHDPAAMERLFVTMMPEAHDEPPRR